MVDPKEIKKVGADLAGSGGLNCIACHTFQQKLSQTMPAVDLTEMAQRLHKAVVLPIHAFAAVAQSGHRDAIVLARWESDTQ